MGSGLLFLLKDYISFPEKIFKKDSTQVSNNTDKKSKNVKLSKISGKIIDQFNGVKVYDNGNVRNVSGRNTTKDGYNLGLKYQCVEYVKRYYYEVFNHKMPDSYGHAKEFYNTNLSDGSFNDARALFQYKNGSQLKPRTHDLLVYGAASFNQFGHVAIVTQVTANSVECIAQNLGKGNGTRRTYPLVNNNGLWTIEEPYILGWLRKS